MYSEKMVELGTKSSVIRDIFEYSKKRKAEIGEDRVFDFSLGNPSIPAPKELTSTLIRLLETTDPVELHGYTSAVGDAESRRRVASNIMARHGFAQPESLIYMTCGAASSLTVTLKALCDEGDEVIIIAPYFPEYEVFVKNANAVPVVAMPKDDLSLNVESVIGAVTPRTRAMIINSPNNPTGDVVDKETLTRLCTALSEKSRELAHPITIVADEPYRALVYDGVSVPYIPAIYDNTVVCTSWSKSLSIPGERIGYVAVSPRAECADELFAAVAGAGRSMGYVCAPSLFQRAASECDTLLSDIAAYDRNRRTLYRALTSFGYECIFPKGAFYLFVRSPEPDAAAFCERAKKHELLLVPSDSFGVTGWVRIAYCVSHDTITRSLPAFERLIKEYKEN